MQLDKEQVLDFLRKEGKNEYVQKAIQELPQKIDHEHHAEMLQQKFGIDPGKLAEKALEKQMGVAPPPHEQTPARPASTGPAPTEPATASRPTEAADPSMPSEPATGAPSTEPADATARPTSTGSAEDDRPPA